jgi:hypothetical protein
MIESNKMKPNGEEQKWVAGNFLIWKDELNWRMNLDGKERGEERHNLYFRE